MQGKKAEIDPDEVEKLASRGLTYEQVALSLGVNRRTFMRSRKANAELEEAFNRGRSKGIAQISNSLFDKAKKGNVVAQIFFLKCVAGWKETQAVEVTDKSPLQIVFKNDLES